MTVATPLMTTEQLLAIPDDGKERWLINGELRFRIGTMNGDGAERRIGDP